MWKTGEMAHDVSKEAEMFFSKAFLFSISNFEWMETRSSIPYSFNCFFPFTSSTLHLIERTPDRRKDGNEKKYEGNWISILVSIYRPSLLGMRRVSSHPCFHFFHTALLEQIYVPPDSLDDWKLRNSAERLYTHISYTSDAIFIFVDLGNLSHVSSIRAK